METVMVKSVQLGIAAATMLAAAVMPPAPANARRCGTRRASRNTRPASRTVQYRRYNRRYARAPVRRYYGTRPLRLGVARYYYRCPYAYAARIRTIRWLLLSARPFIGVGPFGFGVW